MEAYEVGLPDRTYFELFVGEHPSEKIYSVQVADWKKYFKRYDTQTQRDVYDTPDVKYTPTPAVVNEDLSQSLKNRAEHLRVVPTEELREFMQAKGVDLPHELYVQPLAFTWKRDGEFEMDIEDYLEPLDVEQKKKNKTLLAFAVAILSLLN